ncbi:MAG: hypothetical protein JST14_18480 [Bacteroidetes bacterium]|nr:hypothetical protein [Bacteroidota bacterium]MBS1976693.1 hypothetical protein [Bacteroidota bacterium]
MRLFRPILSLSMAFLVLVSSTGMTISMHICGGEVQSLALFSKAEPCMKMEQKPCHSLSIQQLMKGCCEEKSVVVKGKETNAEVKTVTEVVTQSQPLGAVLSVLQELPSRSTNPTYSFHSDGYSPPLIEQDITVLVQSFLI